MPLTQVACTDAIVRHSRGFAAAAARAGLAVPVEHCPGWNVADLVWHLTDVHWFWATIAREKLSAPPDESRRPKRPGNSELLPTFEAGAERLVDVLLDAEPAAGCWTWAPDRQNVGFIVRHQVQEAVVHHWDVCQSAGRSWSVQPEVAADCVEEFLEVSVSGRIGAEFAIQSADTGDAWTLNDGRGGLELTHSTGVPPPTLRAAPAPTLRAPSAALLLWLYERIDIGYDGPPELLACFREMCST
jgi:uncharacterized protein (TIGR03083 family)